jgi:hypothetical protein
MTNTSLTRRRLLGMGLGSVATAGLFSKPARSAASTQDEINLRGNGNFPDSFHRVYSFFDEMMDAYAQGSTLRLTQSYSDQQGLLSTGFTYDNALVIQAYLLRGRKDDIDRARTIGNSLIYAQQNDPNFNDGRLRQAYFVDQRDPNGVFLRLALAPFFFTGTAVGDMAWAAIALAQLYSRTRELSYLNGALNLGNWIFNVTFDTRGAGGYNFGVDGGNNRLLFKSTEHNIDAFALFGMLARLTGTGADGATINRDNIPEDTQTWSFMALRDDLFARSIDWAKTNLATTDTPQTINSRLTGNIRINGSSFASLSLRSLAPSSQFDQPPDPNGVWLEGTGHLAAALSDRKLGGGHDIDGFDGDEKTARSLLDNIELAQERLGRDQTIGGRALTERQGVVAASSVVNTGFGFSFYPNLHLAASAWYVIAGQSGNPFQLGFR